MLDRLAACAHGVRIFVEPFLHGLDNPLVLPPRDATLFSRRALSFDWAGMARIGPITAKFLAVLLSRKTVREFLTRRAHGSADYFRSTPLDPPAPDMAAKTRRAGILTNCGRRPGGGPTDAAS